MFEKARTIGVRLSVWLLLPFFPAGGMIASEVSFRKRTKIVSGPNIVQGQVDTVSLSLPTIPTSLHEPRMRASYLLFHFWDDMDFRDPQCSRDRTFMEQNIVDFISVFPHADTAAIAPAIENLLRRAECDKTAYLLTLEIVEKYLYEKDSPMFDESLYLLFLERAIRSDILDEYEKIRPNYQLRTLGKNRPGTSASDFRYIDREGRPHTLYGTEGDRFLLLFYDLDCEVCQKVVRALQESRTLRECTADDRLTVLAVYVEGDRDRWEATKDALPRQWIVGLDIEHISERELYSFSTLPGIYLLDREKKVLLKDPTQTCLEAYLDDNR